MQQNQTGGNATAERIAMTVRDTRQERKQPTERSEWCHSPHTLSPARARAHTHKSTNAHPVATSARSALSGLTTTASDTKISSANMASKPPELPNSVARTRRNSQTRGVLLCLCTHTGATSRSDVGNNNAYVAAGVRLVAQLVLTFGASSSFHRFVFTVRWRLSVVVV